MSTRATYLISTEQHQPSQCFYIHYDGYEQGAAGYFYNMLKHNGRGGFAGNFVRGNDLASFTGCHDQHGDTEFQYTLDAKGNLEAVAIGFDTGNHKTIFKGLVSDFINQYGANIKDFSPVTHWNFLYGYNEFGTVERVAELALKMIETVESLPPENPNYALHLDRARRLLDLHAVALDEYSEIKYQKKG